MTATVNLDDITLTKGIHRTRETGVCAMEAAAWLAGEEHSDHPECVCPVIAEFLRVWNDNLPDETRDRLLKPLLPLILDTNTGDADDQVRIYLAFDWLVRVNLPAWLDLTPELRPHADRLRSLPPVIAVTDEVLTSLAATRAAGAAWGAAAADARNAAREAVGAAARDAAREAVGAAVVWDLATDDGPFTYEHRELLVAPWESVIGTIEGLVEVDR